MYSGFDGIWDELGIPLRSYIKRRVHNEHDMEDILQTVFLKIIGNLQNLKDNEKIYAWAYCITRNTIIDYYKTQKQDLNIDDYVETIQAEPYKENTVDKEISECIKIMLHHLPEKYKKAILLTEFQKLTQKELAIRMGISESAAKSRVQRARRNLRKMLFSCCNFEKDCRGNVIDYEIRNKSCNNYC